MVNEPSEPPYRVREIPFDEWVDIDVLVHRTSLTNGDFDYLLRPVCSDCGQELDLEYDSQSGDGELVALVCGACQIEWRLSPES